MSTEADIFCINNRLDALVTRDGELLAGIEAVEERLDTIETVEPADGVVLIGPDNVIDWSLGDSFVKVASGVMAFTFANPTEGKEITVVVEGSGTWTAVNPFDAQGAAWPLTAGPPDIANVGFMQHKFKFHRINNRIYADTIYDTYA